MKNIIVLKNVEKEFGQGSTLVKAVKKANIDIKEQDFLGIMGPSGSGKSTLLNLIATLDMSTRGSIQVGGKDIKSLQETEISKFRRETIGFIFQDCNLLDTLTIRDNILAPLMLSSYKKDEADKLVLETAKKIGIEHLLDKFPAECSGGERQRAAACRAMIRKPKVIIADEPTAALDTKNSIELLEVLTKLNKEEKIAIVIVTHEALIGSYCDRILMIRDGRIEKEIKKNNNIQSEFYKKLIDETFLETQEILEMMENKIKKEVI